MSQRRLWIGLIVDTDKSTGPRRLATFKMASVLLSNCDALAGKSGLRLFDQILIGTGPAQPRWQKSAESCARTTIDRDRRSCSRLVFGRRAQLACREYAPCDPVSRKPRTPRRSIITVSGVVGPPHRLHSIAISRLRLSLTRAGVCGSYCADATNAMTSPRRAIFPDWQ